MLKIKFLGPATILLVTSLSASWFNIGEKFIPHQEKILKKEINNPAVKESSAPKKQEQNKSIDRIDEISKMIKEKVAKNAVAFYTYSVSEIIDNALLHDQNKLQSNREENAISINAYNIIKKKPMSYVEFLKELKKINIFINKRKKDMLSYLFLNLNKENQGIFNYTIEMLIRSREYVVVLDNVNLDHFTKWEDKSSFKSTWMKIIKNHNFAKLAIRSYQSHKRSTKDLLDPTLVVNAPMEIQKQMAKALMSKDGTYFKLNPETVFIFIKNLKEMNKMDESLFQVYKDSLSYYLSSNKKVKIFKEKTIDRMAGNGNKYSFTISFTGKIPFFRAADGERVQKITDKEFAEWLSSSFEKEQKVTKEGFTNLLLKNNYIEARDEIEIESLNFFIDMTSSTGIIKRIK